MRAPNEVQAQSDLRSLRECDFNASTEQGQRKDVVAAGPFGFSPSAWPAAIFRRERLFAFDASRTRTILLDYV